MERVKLKEASPSPRAPATEAGRGRGGQAAAYAQEADPATEHVDHNEGIQVKTRKPYTISKQRERWTDEEHQRFLEGIKLYGRAWPKIEEHVGTKTAVQIRSHAQKFMNKLERQKDVGEDASGSFASAGGDTFIPPPRPKRKPNRPYPRKQQSGGIQQEAVCGGAADSTSPAVPTSSGGNRNTAQPVVPYSAGQQDSSRLALQHSAAARAHSCPDASQQLGETTQPSPAALLAPSDTGLGDVGQPMPAWLPGAEWQVKAGLQTAMGGTGAGGGLAAHRLLPLAYPQQANAELLCTQQQLPGPKQQQHNQVQKHVLKKEGTPRPASGPRLGPAALDMDMQTQSTRPAALLRAVPQQTQQSSAPAAVATADAASNGDVTEATVAAVAAAASAAAAAAAAGAHPPQGFPFFGLPPSLLAQITLQNPALENMAWGAPLASGQAPGNARAWEAAPVSGNAAFWSQVVQQVDHHCHTHHHHFYHHHSVEQTDRQAVAGSLAEATTTTDGTVVDQHKHRQLPAQGHHHPALELPEMRLQQQQQRQAIAQDEGRQQQALQAAVLLGGLMAKQGNAPGPESSSVMPEQQQHPVRGKGARPTVAGGRGVLAWAGSRPLKRGRSRDTGAEASEELDDGDSGDADVGLGEDQPLRAASLLAQLAGISPTGPLQGGQQQGAHSGREGLRQTAMANGGPPSREDDRSGWRRRESRSVSPPHAPTPAPALAATPASAADPRALGGSGAAHRLPAPSALPPANGSVTIVASSNAREARPQTTRPTASRKARTPGGGSSGDGGGAGSAMRRGSSDANGSDSPGRPEGNVLMENREAEGSNPTQQDNGNGSGTCIDNFANEDSGAIGCDGVGGGDGIVYDAHDALGEGLCADGVNHARGANGLDVDTTEATTNGAQSGCSKRRKSSSDKAGGPCTTRHETQDKDGNGASGIGTRPPSSEEEGNNGPAGAPGDGGQEGGRCSHAGTSAGTGEPDGTANSGSDGGGGRLGRGVLARAERPVGHVARSAFRVPATRASPAAAIACGPGDASGRGTLAAGPGLLAATLNRLACDTMAAALGMPTEGSRYPGVQLLGPEPQASFAPLASAAAAAAAAAAATTSAATTAVTGSLGQVTTSGTAGLAGVPLGGAAANGGHPGPAMLAGPAMATGLTSAYARLLALVQDAATQRTTAPHQQHAGEPQQQHHRWASAASTAAQGGAALGLAALDALGLGGGAVAAAAAGGPAGNARVDAVGPATHVYTSAFTAAAGHQQRSMDALHSHHKRKHAGGEIDVTHSSKLPRLNPQGRVSDLHFSALPPAPVLPMANSLGGVSALAVGLSRTVAFDSSCISGCDGGGQVAVSDDSSPLSALARMVAAAAAAAGALPSEQERADAVQSQPSPLVRRPKPIKAQPVAR